MINNKPSEESMRLKFNSFYRLNTTKQRLALGNGGAKHEFDLYDAGKLIGGINTSPWKNKTGSNNTGGQDRVSTELLWLSLWEGKEKRVVVLTDREMAERIISRFSGCAFPNKIEIILYDHNSQDFIFIGFIP
jgi:hypothetical protein